MSAHRAGVFNKYTLTCRRFSGIPFWWIGLSPLKDTLPGLAKPLQELECIKNEINAGLCGTLVQVDKVQEFGIVSVMCDGEITYRRGYGGFVTFQILPQLNMPYCLFNL